MRKQHWDEAETEVLGAVIHSLELTAHDDGALLRLAVGGPWVCNTGSTIVDGIGTAADELECFVGYVATMADNAGRITRAGEAIAARLRVLAELASRICDEANDPGGVFRDALEKERQARVGGEVKP